MLIFASGPYEYRVIAGVARNEGQYGAIEAQSLFACKVVGW
jgi:hypothetical protein